MNVLSGVALELNKNLFGGFKVFPWALGSDIHPAVGITSPAILARVEEIVGVSVCRLLMSVVALAVEPVLRLQG